MPSPQTSGFAILSYLHRCGLIWIKFQLKPLILDPNPDIHVNYAYWGGAPLALSLGRCQFCIQKLDYWSELRGKFPPGTSFERMSFEMLSFEMSEDNLSKGSPALVGLNPRGPQVTWVEGPVQYLPPTSIQYPSVPSPFINTIRCFLVDPHCHGFRQDLDESYGTSPGAWKPLKLNGHRP